MLNKVRGLVEEVRMRLLIRRLRKDLGFFGYDVSRFTDQELLDLVGLMGDKVAQASREAGVSLEQMAAILTNVAAAFRRMEDLTDA